MLQLVPINNSYLNTRKQLATLQFYENTQATRDCTLSQTKHTQHREYKSVGQNILNMVIITIYKKAHVTPLI